MDKDELEDLVENNSRQDYISISDLEYLSWLLANTDKVQQEAKEASERAKQATELFEKSRSAVEVYKIYIWQKYKLQPGQTVDAESGLIHGKRHGEEGLN